jgi:hypothetical protein
MSDKVLFELRIHTDEDGTRIDVHESAEWRAYHGTDRGPDRGARRVGCADGGPLAWAMRFCCNDEESAERQSDPRKRPSHADDLRRALDSLQNIYDDLYGDATA